MRKVVVCLIVCGGLFYAASGFTATLIESMDSDGSTEKMWLEGSRVRVDISDEPSYMLVDVKAGKMFSINTEEKEAFDLSGAFRSDSSKPAADKVDAQFVKVGPGPDIAGYATVHYQLTVDNQKCSDEFLSTKALEDIQSLEIFEALSKIADSENMDFDMDMMDPCDAATVSFDKTYQKLGFPLKTIARDGSVESEVVRITRNAPTPPGWFDMPSGYEVIDMGQMLQESMEGYSPEEGEGDGNPPSEDGDLGQDK